MHEVATEYLNTPNLIEKLDGMATDWQRYTFCRQRAEHFRRQFFDEERSYIANVLATDADRYAGMSKSQRIAQATVKWETSVKGQNLFAAEAVWHRWAQGYLAAWQAKTLHNLVKALERRPSEESE
jgi:hypothetical protein